MLDVHPPEHTPHNFRDFTIHLLTITAGLLIALALEAGVEGMHHRHQREEADATIRRELTENRDSLKKNQAVLQSEKMSLVKTLRFGEARLKGQPGDATGISLAFSECSLQDAAWRTSAATGVLAYMDYNQAQAYAMAYHFQDQYLTMQADTLEQYLGLISYIVENDDPTTVSPEDLREALPKVRQALVRLGAMSDMNNAAVASYDKALQ